MGGLVGRVRGRFYGPGGIIGVSCEGYGSLLAWGWPFPGSVCVCGGGQGGEGVGL